MRITLLIALIFLAPGLAMAQETLPGSSCDAGETDYIRQVGGPETSGVVHLMRCDGSTWFRYVSFYNGGVVSFGVTRKWEFPFRVLSNVIE